MRCPFPSAGPGGGNLADLSDWPSSMSCVYMWVKSLHTDDNKSLQKHQAECSEPKLGIRLGVYGHDSGGIENPRRAWHDSDLK